MASGLDKWSGLLVVVLLASLLAASSGAAGATTLSHSVETPTSQEAGASHPATSVSDIETGENATTTRPRIVELYPSPVASGNTGEFVAIEFPNQTHLDGWALSDDGRQEADLPNETVEGTVAFSHDPNETARHTDHEVFDLDGHIQFAEDGEEVTLQQNGSKIDHVAYDRASEAELWRRDSDGERGTWTPIEATDFEPVTTGESAATTFVLPDDPETPVELIEGADDRVLLAAYTYSDARVTDALIDAHERGVDVQVAVEASPVGGTTNRSVDQLDALTEADIDTVAFGGDYARHRFHHGKFAVADDEAIVLTENWNPSGTGGGGNRGWGVVTHDTKMADAVVDVFEADVERRDALPWSEYREHVDPVEEPLSSDTFQNEFDPHKVSVTETRLLTAPDNAEEELLAELDDAEESLLITQVSIGGRDDPLLDGALDAARRGVTVEVLLSDAWYADEENEELQTWLETTATEEDLDFKVRLADPRDRYEKVHTKGVVIDEETVIIGSVNWNTHSLRENRELAFVLVGTEVAAYYADVFRSDWETPVPTFPIGLGAVLIGAVVGGAILARKTVGFSAVGA